VFEYINRTKPAVDIDQLINLHFKNIIKQDQEKERVIVEIGAYDGSTILNLIRSTKLSTLKLHAVEPSISNFKTLKRTLQGYPECEVHHCAISHITDTIFIYSKSKELEQGVSLYPEFVGTKSRDKLQRSTVRTYTLDDFCRKQYIEKIDLLRINCEGGEFNIFSDECTLKILGNTKLVAITIHGKANIFLTTEMIERKIQICDILKYYRFEQVYGFRFDNNITKVPVGHVWQIWKKY